MAMGKARSNKRSSGSSQSSTLTTIIFVALCIFGLWLLAPSNILYPLSTSATTSSQSSSITDSHENHPTKPIAKKSQPIFEDSQGDLPEDAIKPDHETIHDDHKDESSELPNDSAVMGSLTEKETEVSNDNRQDSEQEINGRSESSEDNNNEAEGDGGGKEDTDVKEKDSDVEVNTQELHGTKSVEELEKQKKLETQDSEESSITQNQEAEKTREEQTTASADKDFEGNEIQHTRDDQSGGENHQEDSPSEEKLENHESSEDKEHEISDEDQQKRLEQHHQQEDDQIQQGKSQEETEGSTSHDQIEHDEVPLAQIGNQNVQSTVRGWKDPSKLDTSDSSPSEESSEIPKESKESKKSWSTQACLDNEKAIAKLQSRRHYEHRERHCPEEAPTCLVPLPKGYKKPIEWPQSRDKIWYHNVPHTKLAEVKGHQNWVKVMGEFLTFPGGGTQFIHGALHYIDFLEEGLMISALDEMMI